MKPIALAPLLLLAACSPRAQNETADAADAITADANATMQTAAKDVDAASDRAFGAATNVAQPVGNAIDAAVARGKAKAARPIGGAKPADGQ